MPSIPVDEKPVVSGPGRTRAEPSQLVLIREEGGYVKTTLQSFSLIFPDDFEAWRRFKWRRGSEKDICMETAAQQKQPKKKPTENETKLRKRKGGAAREEKTTSQGAWRLM